MNIHGDGTLLRATCNTVLFKLDDDGEVLKRAPISEGELVVCLGTEIFCDYPIYRILFRDEIGLGLIRFFDLA